MPRTLSFAIFITMLGGQCRIIKNAENIVDGKMAERERRDEGESVEETEVYLLAHGRRKTTQIVF